MGSVNAITMDIKSMGDEIISVLNMHGFVIQRYDSLSTDSLYLKLDYGACNSIRIADHKGKEHLKYRYNLLKDSKQRVAKDDGLPRYYYPYEQLKALIDQILKDRNAKLSMYGKKRYNEFMEKNKKDHRDSNGFWKDSKVVSKVQ